MTYHRLGDLLLNVGAISQEQLEKALELQKSSRQRLGTVLVENGFITEGDLIEALRLQLGIEFIDLTKTIPSTDMAQMVSKNIAKKYGVVPVRAERDTLYLAMSDPLNFVAIEEVRKACRKKVTPMIATAAAVDHTIATLYGNEGAAKAIEDMKREAAASGTDTAQVYTTTTVEDDANSAPTVRLVNSIISRAVTERASDIHLEPHEDELRVRMRIDGVMHNILTVPRELHASVLSRLKVMGNMDVAERRLPQDGRANVRVKQKDIDLRMSTIPTIHGEKLVIRLLDKSSQILDPVALGLSGQDLKRYDALLEVPTGMVLLVGPTGSGKSSTMYTMLHELNTEEVNIVTLEDPVEYHLEGVNQVQINEKVGMTFAEGLRSILRQDPDIIAVGEIRDGETASIAMRSAMTGHMVLSTVHTGTAASAIDRLLDIGVEPYLIASALRGIVSQRLARRICPDCREEYTPSDEELEALGLRGTSGRFSRGVGCPNCFHTGYRGRIGVFEIMMVDAALRHAISTGKDRDEITRILSQGNFVSLADNVRRLVLSGITTVEEAHRIIHASDI